jgi:signal transduction histidine kinase
MKCAVTIFLGLSCCVLTTQLAAQVAVTAVRVDGVAVALPPVSVPAVNGRPTLSIPPGAKDVEFTLDASELKWNQPYRLRYKLEGVDPGWNMAYSHMRMLIRFLDAGNTLIYSNDFKVDHESPGWRGSVEKSEFTPGHGEAIAPLRAAKVQLWFGSGGPEYTTGMMAFRNVAVRVGGPEEETFQEVRYSTEIGEDLDQILGSPADWRRDGNSPQMAQVLRLEQPQPHHVLVLNDGGPQSFAAWLVPTEKCIPVRPGQRVSVEWEECHAVGAGGSSNVAYHRLAAGNYWLRVGAVGMDGSPVGTEMSLPFVVLTPVWARLWFWLVIGGVGSLGGFLGSRWVMKRRLALVLDLAERRQMVERERTRIARDIHDDLGTSLTQISMLSESARSNPSNPPATVNDLDRICTAVRESTQAMDEIVWAADPENDLLDELANYVSGFAQELLTGVGVRCRLEMPTCFPRCSLSAEVRHNVFLAFKEALNNALKHSQPREVRITMVMEGSHFVLSVEDDGRGYAQPTRVGHGLANMRSRLEKLGGQALIESNPGKGTRVRFVVPLDFSA